MMRLLSKELKMTPNAGTSASAMLVAAVEIADIHKRAAEGKARAADTAHAKCANLVARAAAGGEIDAASLMQAQDEVRVAGAEFDIADAIHRGAEKRRQEAEVSVWFEQAENLKKAVERRLDERFAAAAVVDLCLAELQRAIGHFNYSGQRFLGARIAASQFTSDRGVRVAANPVLAAMPAGTHPNAKNNYNAEVRQIKAAVFDANGGLERPVAIESLAQREAFLWGRKASEA
jgi:hypothetical protein